MYSNFNFLISGLTNLLQAVYISLLTVVCTTLYILYHYLEDIHYLAITTKSLFIKYADTQHAN